MNTILLVFMIMCGVVGIVWFMVHTIVLARDLYRKVFTQKVEADPRT